jgi:hypothetical protein
MSYFKRNKQKTLNTVCEKDVIYRTDSFKNSYEGFTRIDVIPYDKKTGKDIYTNVEITMLAASDELIAKFEKIEVKYDDEC